MTPGDHYRADGYGRGKHFPRSILTPEFVRSAVESRDGVLFWKERADHYFRSWRGRTVWNSKVANREISIRLNDRGYKFFCLCGYEIYHHHFVWMMKHGRWPKEIDHINGVRSDNRLENLREVTRAINSKNRALRSDNKSGHVGVYRQKTRWRAFITIDGKTRFIGGFRTREEAIAARLDAQRGEGFTERHGKAR